MQTGVRLWASGFGLSVMAVWYREPNQHQTLNVKIRA
jgi:hypothetical protein